MKLKKIVRRVAPPLLADLYRNLRPGRHVWEGVYPHFRDVPAAGQGFDGNTWVAGLRDVTERARAEARTTSAPPLMSPEFALLATVVATICHRRGNATVLDFGGGMGLGFIELARAMDARAVSYHVVEMASVCATAETMFLDDPRIHFHRSLPDELENLDVVFVCSALQYVEDYPALIQRLARYRAPYFAYSNLSSGDVPTFATAQKNVRGSSLPYWFFNMGEILELMEESGYALLYRSQLAREYEPRNLPAAYRLKNACNLLFGLRA